MSELLTLVEQLRAGTGKQDGKSQARHLGIVSCNDAVYIRHVAFFDPCLIMVLAGKKTIGSTDYSVSCEVESMLAVPAPAAFDVRNDPDPKSKKYRALIIPFTPDYLEELSRNYALQLTPAVGTPKVLGFKRDEQLASSIRHYLGTPNEPKLLKHRIMETLLILSDKDPRLLSFILNQKSWSQRARAILSTNLAHDWNIAELCRLLATSESSLRRRLRHEQTGFRELLAELRLNTALMQLMTSSRPIYQVAYDCGYQSLSRFSGNFRKRFGLSPSELRTSDELPVTENGQKQTVYG